MTKSEPKAVCASCEKLKPAKSLRPNQIPGATGLICPRFYT